MIKAPLRNDGGEALSSAGVTSQLAMVFLVIALGATIYLWRARYMRTRTSYITIAVLVLAMLILGTLMYRGAV